LGYSIIKTFPLKKYIMRKKFVVINHGNCLNNGTSALLRTRIKSIQTLIPDIKFSVFTFSSQIESDLSEVKFFESIGSFSLDMIPRTFGRLLRCHLWVLINRYFRKDLRKLRNISGFDEYIQADLIISTGGDVLTEDYGTLSFLSYFINFYFAILLNKPIIIYGETIGPFKHFYNKILIRYLLNNSSLITVRENISFETLKLLKISTPFHLSADSAFLLEPVSKERVNSIFQIEHITKSKPIVGIAVSKLISGYGFNKYSDKESKYQAYVDLMSQCIQHVISTYNMTIMFVPHVIIPGHDDRVVALDILKTLPMTESIISINNEYTPEELKAIIGNCDIFIGARMHACIAAISSCVPTIAISYGTKTQGIIGDMLGLSDYIINIEEINFYKIKLIIDNIILNRLLLKKQIESNINNIRAEALKNTLLIKDFIN
jgi:colanic acid/amylovoran biosynthesis protein